MSSRFVRPFLRRAWWWVFSILIAGPALVLAQRSGVDQSWLWPSILLGWTDAVARRAGTQADPGSKRDELDAGRSLRAYEVGRLSRALASYVRSILSGDSSYDRFTNGDRKALSAAQQLGFRSSAEKGTARHAMWARTSPTNKSTTPALPGATDSSRMRGFEISSSPRDHGAFKTPPLREIARTGPYMHDGSMATLEEVIDFYSGGGRPNPYLDSEIRPRNLTTEERAHFVPSCNR